MRVPSRNYVLHPDGTHTVSEMVEEVNPDDYRFYTVPNLPGIQVGVRLEEGGEVTIPEGTDR